MHIATLVIVRILERLDVEYIMLHKIGLTAVK